MDKSALNMAMKVAAPDWDKQTHVPIGLDRQLRKAGINAREKLCEEEDVEVSETE